ncbi:MAG: sigma-70 family RNA polymerase sigma factor [Pseudomonadota bacterium]
MSTGPNPDQPEQSDDAALIHAIAQNADKAAFSVLFGRFAGRVKGFLIKSGAAPEQAEEIAQEVMITVWRKAKSYDPTKAAVATWIYTIARNRRIDQIRRENRPEPDPDDPQYQPDPEPDSALQFARETRDAKVRAALSELSADQLDVVRLSFFAGLSHGEIAAQLSLPLGTIKSRLRLSFARLRGELGQDFSQELEDD